MGRMSKKAKAAAKAREAKQRKKEAAAAAGVAAPPPPPRAGPLVIAPPAPEAADPLPDWMKLPRDLLNSVLLKLPTDADLILSSTTCRSWCSAIGEMLPMPKFPVLIFNREADHKSFETKFYCFSRRRFYTISLPHHPLCDDPPETYLAQSLYPLQNENVFHGVSHGWMIIADERSDLYLYNPITGTQIKDLPPIATIDFFEAVYNDQGELTEYIIDDGRGKIRGDIEFPRNETFSKVVLSKSPASGDCTVMLTFRFNKTVYAQLGDEKWKTAATKRIQDDIISYDGDFYTIRRDRYIQVLDSRGRKKFSVNIIWPMQRIPTAAVEYLASSPYGSLFYIRLHQVFTPIITNPDNTKEFLDKSKNRPLPYLKCFQVFEVDIATGQLVGGGALDNVGNHAFLISNNDAMCISCEKYPQYMPNCIYHTILFYVAVGIYNLATKTVSYMELADESDGFVGWQPLSWMTPPHPLISYHDDY